MDLPGDLARFRAVNEDPRVQAAAEQGDESGHVGDAADWDDGDPWVQAGASLLDQVRRHAHEVDEVAAALDGQVRTPAEEQMLSHGVPERGLDRQNRSAIGRQVDRGDDHPQFGVFEGGASCTARIVSYRVGSGRVEHVL